MKEMEQQLSRLELQNAQLLGESNKQAIEKEELIHQVNEMIYQLRRFELFLFFFFFFPQILKNFIN